MVDNFNSVEVDDGMLEDRFTDLRPVEISLTTPVIHIDLLPDQIVLEESIASGDDPIDFITNSVIGKSNAGM